MSRERQPAARNVARDVARRRAEETTHGGGGSTISLPEGVNFFKNDGKTVEFDHIPYVISSLLNPDVRAGRAKVGDLIDSRVYRRHTDIGVDQKMYICPTSIGKPCPICEAHTQAKKNSAMSKEEVDALRAKERVLYNVIDVNDKNAKVMVWDVSYHLFTKQLEHEQAERNEYYEYWYPDGGHTLRIRFEMKKINRGEPFPEADRIDFTKRQALSDEDLDAAVDLDEVLQILDYKQLEKIFLGVDNDSEEEPEDKTPARNAAPVKDAEKSTSEPAGRTARSGRESAPAEPPTRASRGRAMADDTIHEKAPDAPTERGRHERESAGKHAVDPEQDCPGGGTFGTDESKLDFCNDCPENKWKACREEKDRITKTAKAKKSEVKQPEEPRRGRR
jgi:hypothetical protein